MSDAAQSMTCVRHSQFPVSCIKRDAADAMKVINAGIRAATRDATKGKPAHMVAAWEYFTGPSYREHLRWLGVSTFRYPDGLKF